MSASRANPAVPSHSGAAARYLILLGSNIDPARHLRRARERIECDLVLERWSRVYESDAVGAPGAPRFQNQAGLVRTPFDARTLKEYCRALEAALGRRRTADPNAARTIDIDVLLGLDDRDQVRLDVPRDPHLNTHHHVCIPAAEILGELRIPGADATLAECSARLGSPPAGFVEVDGEQPTSSGVAQE
ncbi:MAG: 2-amino-4-hydroxy-6-hydroxymethyldihydropteridine diphosphokinase [Planctomycetota bacterium]